MENKKRIEKIALEIRQNVLKMAMRANGGHIAPSYSITDIITVLFFDGILKYDSKNPHWDERDYFILSKGHGVMALYVALSMAGFFPKDVLYTFCKPGSDIGSLAKANSVPGIEASTGSLGHGLSYACGIAKALKEDKLPNRVFALLGDGECEEGSIWEALMFAVHNELDNLTIIVDNNMLQAMDTIDSIMSLGSFTSRFKAFGIETIEIDGHDYYEICNALNGKAFISKGDSKKRPKAIIAHTIKGKGISFMENVPIWHYRIPNEEELKIALNELNMTQEDLGSFERLSYRNII